jgi:hypothetical protein
MAEIRTYILNHTELAEMIVKNLGIHEGLWAVYFEFALGGANIPTSPDGKSVMPAALTIIQKVGIQRFDTPTNLTVDAAIVNPTQPSLI